MTQHEPRTQRMDHDEFTGKPCIHFTDQQNIALQVHARPDAPGFYVSVAMLVTLPLGLGTAVQEMAVDLTPGQVNDLLAYLHANV